jgi:hypothetical protein
MSILQQWTTGMASGSYWNQRKINDSCLFFASDNTDILNKVVSTQLPNQVTGATDYFTVTGIGLNARYRTPDTAAYKTADSDYVFWKTDASESTCDGNRLVGYDFPRILVKYLNVAPYTILWIAILKPGVTVTNDMRDAFDLSVWWDNTFSFHGSLKGNKPLMQQYQWTPETVIPAILTDTSKTYAFFDFRDQTTITKDGSNRVSKVDDKSGSNNHLLQSGADAIKPISGVNGIVTNGTNQILKTASAAYVWPVSIYLVVRQITWTDADVLVAGYDANALFLIARTATPGYKVYTGNYSSLNNNLAVGEWSVVKIQVKDGSTPSKFQIDETAAVTDFFGTTAVPMNGISIGGDSNASLYGNGEFAVGCFCKGYLSSGDEAAIVNYLNPIRDYLNTL